MRRRWLALVALVVLVVGGGLAWWLTRPEERPAAGARGPAAADPWAGDDTAAVLAEKRAQRGDAPVDARPAALGGSVRRAADGAAVAGAVVTVAPREFGGAQFSSRDETDAVEAVTDADGRWRAPSVRPGAYVVSAAAADLLPASLDVDVAPGESRDDLTLSLAAGGHALSGTVTDIGGGPIAGAKVTVRQGGLEGLGASATYVAVTAADGAYRLNLPDGSWEATASHADYRADSRSFEVRGRPQTLDFELTPGGVVRGVVIARDSGRPLPGLRVTASGGAGGRARGDDGLRGGATTDDQGAFTLRGVGAGALALRASGKGYASEQPTIVEVGIGEEVGGVRVTVDRAYTVSGFVVRKGSAGEGIAGVRIGIFSFGDGDASSFAPAPSAADGYFEIHGVRPGRYLVAAFGEDLMPEIGQPVRVIDRDITDLLVTMDDGVTLSGKVSPPAVATLSLEPDLEKVGLGDIFQVAKAAMARATSEPDGTFTMRAVPAGTFTLRARVADGRGGALEVTVASTDQRGLVVELEERGAISGRVVDVTGAAVGGVTVEASREATGWRMNFGGGGPGETTTAPDGSFRLVGLEPATYTLEVSDEDGPLAWAERGATDPTATVSGSGEVSGVTLTVEARDGVIRGVVVGPDRQPVADAWVTARPARSPWRRRLEAMAASRDEARDAGVDGARTTVTVTVGGDDGDAPDDDGPESLSGGRTVLAADGRFTIGTLRRGEYVVIGEATKGSLRGQLAGVKTGDSVTVALEPLGVLTVAVTSAGAPVASYDLRCSGPAGEVRRSVQAADGTVALERQPAGSYQCHASADPGTASGKVTLAGSARLPLALTAWASVTGVVVDGQGRPREGVRVIAHGEGQDMSEQMQQLITGGGVVTGADGRFEVGRLAAGKGNLMLMDATGLAPLATRDLTLTAGQRLDLGTIQTGAGDAGVP